MSGGIRPIAASLAWRDAEVISAIIKYKTSRIKGAGLWGTAITALSAGLGVVMGLWLSNSPLITLTTTAVGTGIGATASVALIIYREEES